MTEAVSSNKVWTFKAIVSDGDNWVRDQAAYAGQVRADQVAEIEKRLGCGDPAPGYATYICLQCGEQMRVCFSCKSRGCSRCGKGYADAWAQELTRHLFNVTHRQVTFTVPAELWPLLEAHPEWRKVLFGAANRTWRKVLKAQPGIVMGLHPYGNDWKVTYHLHGLVTEGGLTKTGDWQNQAYLNYRGLRKIWQYEWLTALRTVMPKTIQTAHLVDRLFTAHRDGFYVYAKPRVTEGQGVSRYIGRYLRHPAIAAARILAYDGTPVTFYYEDHDGVRHRPTWPVLDFIHGVVRPIPPKHFKMVRYFGLYAPRKTAQVQAIVQQMGRMVDRVIHCLTWRTRIQHDFARDPLLCPRCGTPDMELDSLTIRWRGQLKTVGGLNWLFKRGVLHETDPAPQPEPVSVPIPAAQQLALGL